MLLYQYDNSNHHLLLQVKGNLDDESVSELHFCYNRHKIHLKSITIDCKAVIYLDSSFIPFLINLRKDAIDNDFNVIFCNMNDTILHEYRLLNLHKLFSPKYNDEKMTVFWQLRE